MKNNSPTEAGQTKHAKGGSQDQRIDAINQAFALFKLNYHNQFLKAFASEADVIALKRLWLDALTLYSANTILHAAKSIVKASEFLPTLKTMLSHCERVSDNALPNIHAAYAEACCSASPKVEQNWSHPAVYFAGKTVGWHFLQSNTENIAFPVFKEAYLSLCERVRGGEMLNMPDIAKIEQKPIEPASTATTEKYMSALNSLLNEEEN